MPTILIVDDVVENVRLLKNLVQDLGNVVFANDGQAALEQVQRHHPDLILLDIMLPGVDGYEICRRLKAIEYTRAIPVIFITGADGEVDEARGLELGAIDYITKPFSPTVVRARVQNHLALVQARDELRKANDELRRLATTDVLTNCANRRHLMEIGERELARANRGSEALSLLMLDIDHFKAVNDKWGHPAGDAVIRLVADTCRETIRPSDSVGRMGGEEFAIVLPATEMAGALDVAERVRAKVETAALEWSGRPIHVTVSIGAATDPAIRDFGSLVKAADEALYRAKRDGRNRVVAAARAAKVQA